jgi:hypothetical protein
MALTPKPSELRVTTLSIDSRFADQIYGSTADYMIRLPATMRNVGRVGLTSIEVPQVAYVFSGIAGISNINFSVVVGAVVTPLDISAGTYTAASLAAAITEAMAADVSGECLYDSIGNRFSFVNTGGPVFSVLLQSSDPVVAGRSRDWGLGYNLGFRTGTVVVTTSVTAPASPLLLPPAYMLFQLQCPDMMENTLHRLADGSFLQAMGKVVLRPGYFDSGYYQVQYDDSSNNLRKENVFVRPTSITQLRIRLLDAYGNVVDMGDTDWSATLEFTEVVSSCEYGALNRAMPSRC